MPGAAVIGAIKPARAPVIPRGTVYGIDSELLPIELHVRQLLRRHSTIAIVGPSGSGKTMTLRHLAAVLSDLSIQYLDEPGEAYDDARPTILTAIDPPRLVDSAILELAPWGESELIDYLLARHPAQVRSVMERLAGCAWIGDLDGSPRLWATALQQMAEVPTLVDVPRMFRQAMNVLLGVFGLDAAIMRRRMAAAVDQEEGAQSLNVPALLQHPYMLRLALVDEMIDSIDERPPSQWWLRQRDTLALRDVANRLRGDSNTTDRLRLRLLKSSERTAGEIGAQGPMASVMIAVDPSYRPTANVVNLDLVQAKDVDWSGLSLTKRSLCHADLRGAKLSLANLSDIDGVGIDLRQADLSGAMLADARLPNARLDEAALPDATLRHADCSRVSAVTANFNDADLRGADFCGADLRGASFVRANLSFAMLIDTRLDAADLTEALLCSSMAASADWRNAILSRACFADAKLNRAIFADMRIDGLLAQNASLVDADLTGLCLRGANLAGANLRQAGLAEIDWEGADLRDADFTHAAFHMGSSRSGLVGSPIACEGSRTGFYTDDYAEQDYRPAEAIRKANLCGANLLGAKVTGTDWYLVDLRGAKYTASQAEWFRKCGAILFNR